MDWREGTKSLALYGADADAYAAVGSVALVLADVAGLQVVVVEVHVVHALQEVQRLQAV